MLGDTLTDLRRYDEAAEAYTRSLGLRADNPRALMGLGYLRYRRGLLKEADKTFQRAAKAADGAFAAEASFFRGVVAEDRDQLSRALKYYKRARKADPNSTDYLLALAALYERLDRPVEALNAYRAAAKLDETDALSLFQCGLIEADRENGAEALKHLQAAIARDKKLLDAYLTAGTVCQDLLRNKKQALAWYERYVREGGLDDRVFEWIEELRK